MRHRKAVLKLNKTPSHRKAMFRNMVTSLFKYEKIQTTGAKAKELRRWADHLITLAKRGDLHARRQALAIVREKDVVHKLFEHAAERYGSVSGGYTRVVKLGHRPGDAAPVALVELIFTQDTKKKTKKKKAKSDAGTGKATADSKPAAVKKKTVKSKAADADDKNKDQTSAKKTKAKSAAKTTAKKNAPADEKVKKAEAKAPAKKKSTATEALVEAEKEEKPKKKAKAAAAQDDDADAKKKKDAAKTTQKDEK